MVQENSVGAHAQDSSTRSQEVPAFQEGPMYSVARALSMANDASSMTGPEIYHLIDELELTYHYLILKSFDMGSFEVGTLSVQEYGAAVDQFLDDVDLVKEVLKEQLRAVFSSALETDGSQRLRIVTDFEEPNGGADYFVRVQDLVALRSTEEEATFPLTIRQAHRVLMALPSRGGNASFLKQRFQTLMRLSHIISLWRPELEEIHRLAASDDFQ